jgi:hypothetical protein
MADEEYAEFIVQAEKLYGTLKRKRGRAKKAKVVGSVIRALAESWPVG